MGSEWKEYLLEDLAADSTNAMSTGPFGSAISSKYFTKHGIPVIRGGNLSTNISDKMSDEDLVFVSSEKSREFQRSVVRSGDLIFTCWGTINQVGLITEKLNYPEYIISNKQMKFTPNQTKADPLFLYYLFSSPIKQAEIIQNGIGAAVPGFNLGQLKKHIVNLPSLTEQKKISGYLASFDDKIDLNRQMNTTLESMAQALFKSWFVDFDPVIDNALAAGNPIPEPLLARAETRKALGDKRKPLPEGIRGEFPSGFVFSEEMGWIPEGWSPTPVSKAIEINPKVPLKKGTVAKYVDMKALPTSGFSINEIIEKEYSGGSKFANSDVLLARITPCLENGKTGIVDFLDKDAVGFGSTEFIVLRSKGEIKTPFIAALSRDESFRLHCVTNMVGSSGRQRVQNSCFDNYFLCLPKNANIFIEYHRRCACNFEKITAQGNEISTLTHLRDLLLPKLLSGQLRIPDAEKLAADAL